MATTRFYLLLWVSLTARLVHHGPNAPDDELTPWAAAKVKDIMLKSLNWKVNDIDSLKVYEVFDNKVVHQVDCINFLCTCRKWQLSGLPCGHVCAVSRVCGLTNCNLWAQPWFMNTTLKDTYRELVYPLKDVSTWEAPNDLQQVLPPVMVKQPAGRPKIQTAYSQKGKHLLSMDALGVVSEDTTETRVRSRYLVNKRKRMSNKTHMTQEHLTGEALLDEERARNGRIYQDWYDLPKTPRKRRTNVNSCPPQIVPSPFTEDAMGISEWAGPAEWRQYSYNPMNNWMTQPGDSTNNTYDPSQPSTSQGYMFH
ncbi:transposase, MuDR, MULE transposase domain protein [Tanacetum coccineum]